MADKLKLLRVMARRAAVSVSDPYPLTVYDEDTGEDVDISDGGKYFVRFNEVGGAQKDAIMSAGRQDVVKTEVRGGRGAADVTEETVRTFRLMPMVEEMIRQHVVNDACFPVEQASSDGTPQFQPWKWKKEDSENIAFFKDPRTSYALLSWFVLKAMEWLGEGEEVVDEAGESLEQQESGLAEETV